MTPERWQQIKVAFFGASERADMRERAAYLDATCGEDRDLRERVQSLLDQPPDQFDALADEISRASVDANTGRRVGAYELLRELGRGGMGAVWLARRADRQFEKLVAIKLLKRGTDTDEVLRRFHAERQILARLEHPNIARLLDGGMTDGGLPYFVMEYVAGKPVTEFVRTDAPSVEEQLRLFLKICAAVQFAHQNLVVHRDLKPGNILITAEGEPKLLDFGVAKLLAPGDEALLATMPGRERFTPAYASPEQVRGEPVTTLSDIYAAGTLLYEMLTGKNAHQFTTPHPPPTELLRVVTQEEPERPSAVANDPAMKRRLRGDLDNIVLKALRKEPSRRYQGIGSFATDIHRYLSDRPVTARRDTLGYRASKFVQRNKIGVAAAVVVLITLIGGIIATERQSRRARRQFEQVRRLAHTVLFDYHDAIARLPGSTAIRKKLVSDSLVYLDGLAKENPRDPSLEREIALAYLKVGDVQGEPYTPNLGDTEGALGSYRKAAAMLDRLANASPRDADLQRDLSAAAMKLSQVQMRRGAWDESLSFAKKANATAERLGKTAADRQLLADTYLVLGKALYQGGHAPSVTAQRQGLASFEKALAIRRELASSSPLNPELQRKLSADLSYIGYALWAIGDLTGDRANYTAALAKFSESYEIANAAAAAEPTDTQAQRSRAAALSNIAEKKMLLGDATAARDDFLAALQATQTLAANDPNNVEAQRDVAEIQIGLSAAYQRLEDAPHAHEHSAAAVAILERVQQLDSTSAETATLLATARERFNAVAKMFP